MGNRQNREIALFDPTIPLESSKAPPYTWYTEQEVFDSEKSSIFQKSWLCVGRTEQVNKPGKFFSGNVMGNPYVVVRGEDGGETIAIRSMVYLGLSYDHRVVDGADAARFLVTLKERLEGGAFESDLGL